MGIATAIAYTLQSVGICMDEVIVRVQQDFQGLENGWYIFVLCCIEGQASSSSGSSS